MTTYDDVNVDIERAMKNERIANAARLVVCAFKFRDEDGLISALRHLSDVLDSAEEDK